MRFRSFHSAPNRKEKAMTMILKMTAIVLVTLFSPMSLVAQTKATKPTKAEKKAQKQAAKDRQVEADHVSLPMHDYTNGCVTITSVTFKRDVTRGWGGILYGGSNAVLGISASVNGVIHNNCKGPIVVSADATFFGASGEKEDETLSEVLVISDTGVFRASVDGLSAEFSGKATVEYFLRAAQ
jgi:hypothetical protein